MLCNYESRYSVLLPSDCHPPIPMASPKLPSGVINVILDSGDVGVVIGFKLLEDGYYHTS